MSEAQNQPTKQEVEDVEQKVNELKHEVDKAKRAKTPQPAEVVKRQAEDLTNDTTEAPRKALTVLLISGVVLLAAVLVLALLRSAFVWLAIVLLLVTLLLSGR
jgi:Flp pilus assembly protein TadB